MRQTYATVILKRKIRILFQKMIDRRLKMLIVCWPIEKKELFENHFTVRARSDVKEQRKHPNLRLFTTPPSREFSKSSQERRKTFKSLRQQSRTFISRKDKTHTTGVFIVIYRDERAVSLLVNFSFFRVELFLETSDKIKKFFFNT